MLLGCSRPWGKVKSEGGWLTPRENFEVCFTLFLQESPVGLSPVCPKWSYAHYHTLWIFYFSGLTFPTPILVLPAITSQGLPAPEFLTQLLLWKKTKLRHPPTLVPDHTILILEAATYTSSLPSKSILCTVKHLSIMYVCTYIYIYIAYAFNNFQLSKIEKNPHPTQQSKIAMSLL